MAIMESQQKTLKNLLLPNSKAAKFSRVIDYLIVTIVFCAVMAAIHIHFMLTVGDWDFWVDWKDRQWWVTVTPISLIMLVAAIQGIFWTHFRLAIGATLCGVTLILGEWLNRYFGFYLWAHFPMTLVWPATVLVSCMVLDLVLILSRSYLITALFGTLGFALLFPVSNWAMLAPYRLPIEFQGSMVSVADYIGFHFSRTATPEYLRLIERGTLRTFGGHSTVVAAFFAAFVCAVLYFLWWHIGCYISNMGFTKSSMKVSMGFAEKDEVQIEEGLGGAPDGPLTSDPNDSKAG